ncbi:hypothetical protein PENTCL1PPCAC_10837, partial [Pristionchus entomophagus]
GFVLTLHLLMAVTVAAPNTKDALGSHSIEDANKLISELLIEGDIMRFPNADAITDGTYQSEDATNTRAKRGAPVMNAGRWPKNQPIGYTFISEYEEPWKAAIRAATEQIAANTCLSFQENALNGTKLQIYQGSSQYGCSSFLGHSGKATQLISLNSNCTFVGAVQHEIAHALGLHHTQTRYDRDLYIKVNLTNAVPGCEGNYEKLIAAATNYNYDVPYEYGSKMHYDALSFSKNGLPVITALQSEHQNTMGQAR